MDLPPIPECMKHRPVYKGMAVPFTTFVGPDGVPDFRVNDIVKNVNCMRDNLCVLCGTEFSLLLTFRPHANMWFFGGPKSMESRVFADGPMHPPCARYAIAVCPYLHGTVQAHRDAPARHDSKDGIVVTFDGPPEPRPRMGILKTNGYTVVKHNGKLYWRAREPIGEIDWTTIPNKED